MASEPRLSLNQPSEVSGDQVGNVYDDGYLRIEYDNYYVACGGSRVSLPLKEFLIFSRLTRNVERTVTAQEIWRSAWNTNTPFNSLSLRVHIHRLRRTFHPLGLRIESMVGVGYCLSGKRDGEVQAGE